MFSPTTNGSNHTNIDKTDYTDEIYRVTEMVKKATIAARKATCQTCSDLTNTPAFLAALASYTKKSQSEAIKLYHQNHHRLWRL